MDINGEDVDWKSVTLCVLEYGIFGYVYHIHV